MCNLNSVTKNLAAIRELAHAMHDRSGHPPPPPGISPGYGTPIVRKGEGGRELVLWRWVMLSPLFALTGKKSGSGVTNIPNVKLPHWRRWLAHDEDRPLACLAGNWTRWTSVRKVKEGDVTTDLFGRSIRSDFLD